MLSDTCALIGRLEVQATEKGLPTRLYFVTYSDEPNKLVSEYLFSGSFVTIGEIKDFASVLAYDPNVPAGVADSRFLGGHFYKLNVGDRLPFENSLEYGSTFRRAQDDHERDKWLVLKKKTLLGVLAASTVFFALWIYVTGSPTGALSHNKK